MCPPPIASTTVKNTRLTTKFDAHIRTRRWDRDPCRSQQSEDRFATSEKLALERNPLRPIGVCQKGSSAPRWAVTSRARARAISVVNHAISASRAWLSRVGFPVSVFTRDRRAFPAGLHTVGVAADRGSRCRRFLVDPSAARLFIEADFLVEILQQIKGRQFDLLMAPLGCPVDAGDQA